FVILAGQSSRSRKGTSADRIRAIYKIADLDWADNCIHSGMSSGEGMIKPIRDATTALRRGQMVVTDPGVADKRMLLDEREFVEALVVMRREGNILSRMVREAWDCKEVLGTLTKTNTMRATEPYISIVGHITIEELRDMLDR